MTYHSGRLDYFKTGIFAALAQAKKKLEAEGRTVYSLFVGTPDFKPADHIVKALTDAAADPENWKYSLVDSDELLLAVKDYYLDRYGVEVACDEIMSVNGSQEGMGHLGMALCNPGDVAMIPDPGYPIFEAGSHLGGAELYFYPIVKENNFLPKFSEIPEDILRRAKYIILSYPSNPSGAVAPREMYEEAIAYAKKYGFIIINDNAYSDIVFDGVPGDSFLSIPGAKEVGVEFFSLSKSFNVTGARISFLVGNKGIVDALKLLRTQIDFGMFYPIQHAAIAALRGPRDSVNLQCGEYQRRRDALCGGLRRIGWDVPDSKGTMFVWAPIPANFNSSEEFWKALVEKAGVICTPGNAFGPRGEGYVRFALTLPTETLSEVVDAIDKSGILKS